MAKRVICALEVHDSNLKSFLGYQLSTIRPPKKSRWGRNIKWAFVKKFVGGGGSKIWNHAIKAWKKLLLMSI
jgi:hypothetical protein